RHDFEFLRAELATVGITVQPGFQTFSAFLKKIESGNYQMSEQGWGADYPDAENFYALLYGANKTPGPNSPEYQNPEYDKLYELIRRDVPMIFTWNYVLVGLRQNWIKNFKRNALLDVPFKYMDVDPALKAK